MLRISEKEIKARLQFDNSWWEDGSIEDRFAHLPRRAHFQRFEKLVTDRSVNRAVVLMGPRRVGKTVLVYHAIQAAIDSGVAAAKILYLSLETPIYTGLRLDQFLSFFQEIHGHGRKEELLVFFDEIQYLKDWEIHLKSLVDSYPHYRFSVTGSAAAALRLKSLESGAGRFSEFLLPPLTFNEYLKFIKRDQELIIAPVDQSGDYTTSNIEELNCEFIRYINYGGYPEAVFSATIQADSSRFIKSDIIDKVLLRDLPSLYGVSDIQELNQLFTVLAYNTGCEVSLEELSKSSGVSKNTLKRYIEYLEAAFLIRRVNRVDESAKSFRRNNSFKVYLTNPSMHTALFGYIKTDSASIGELVETVIFAQWFHQDFFADLCFARWKKGEVDLVFLNRVTQKPSWCVEVKWSDAIIKNHQGVAGLVEFAKLHALSRQPIVTTRTIAHNFPVQGIDLKFVPSALYAYGLGADFDV
jgi:uncharacterized protein